MRTIALTLLSFLRSLCGFSRLLYQTYQNGAPLQVSISIPLVAPETEYAPRLNQLDISFSKRIQAARFTLLPKIDFFNALNSDDYSSVSTMQFGAAAYNRPSVILQGRIIRVGVDMTW